MSEPVLKKLLNKQDERIDISEKQAKILEDIPVPIEFKNKKLYCRVWNEDGTRTLTKKPKVIPYGRPFFSMKVGGKDRYFKVNYVTKGMIKNISGKMHYDVAFDNSVGGLALRNVEFPEDIDSEEAYTIFKNNAVNMYVKKGGIPLFYLLIAMGMAMVAFIAIIITVPPGMAAQEQVKQLDTQITVMRQQLVQAQGTITDLRSQITPK